jgi:hypothetical protein
VRRKTTMTTKMCRFEGCENEEDFSILHCCKTCYNGLAYWRGRPRRDKQRRQQQLTKLTARMSHMLDNPRSVPRKRK